MGKKPGEREVKATAPKSGVGFEPNVPCSNCGAPSRRVRPQWRTCMNGHSFIKKSDQ